MLGPQYINTYVKIKRHVTSTTTEVGFHICCCIPNLSVTCPAPRTHKSKLCSHYLYTTERHINFRTAFFRPKYAHKIGEWKVKKQPNATLPLEQGMITGCAATWRMLCLTLFYPSNWWASASTIDDTGAISSAPALGTVTLGWKRLTGNNTFHLYTRQHRYSQPLYSWHFSD